MVRNGASLAIITEHGMPIRNMILEKRREHGVSYGLSEVGYDIRIKQDMCFSKGLWNEPGEYRAIHHRLNNNGDWIEGRFCIASAIEEFRMPNTLVGIVHDKSTWARKGLSVFNTVIEPGWRGFLTLELVYHGQEELHISAGSGIAQVVFHELTDPAAYSGKYQDQADQPVEALYDAR